MSNNMSGNMDSYMNSNMSNYSNIGGANAGYVGGTNSGNVGGTNSGNVGGVSNLMNSNANVHSMQKLSDREKLLMVVQAYEFALYEIGLFLDTHPTDRTALAYFKQYMDLKNRAVADFTRRYGPLTMDNADTDMTTWRWIENPWPWEIGSEG